MKTQTFLVKVTGRRRTSPQAIKELIHTGSRCVVVEVDEVIGSVLPPEEFPLGELPSIEFLHRNGVLMEQLRS